MPEDPDPIAHAARCMLTASPFYDAVLWKLHLQKLLGVGDPRAVADHEREWCQHKADAEAMPAAVLTPWPPGMIAPAPRLYGTAAPTRPKPAPAPAASGRLL